MEMKALILAAGFGVRLREVVHGKPKHLAPISGRPFLAYLIELLRKQGIREVVIAVGYLADRIKHEFGDGRRYGVIVKYSEDDRPLGTAGTVKYAERFFNDDFFVINGDTYIELDYGKIFQFHQRAHADVTIVGTSKHRGKGGLIAVRGDRFVGFVLDESRKRHIGNTGVYVFNPRVLKNLRRGQRASLERDFFPRLVRKGKRVLVWRTNKEYFDIGTPERYREARRILGSL